MTGKRVTAFQASKVWVIESVTVSFDLSPGLRACAMWNTCTDFSLSPPLWVFMHYFGRLCLNYPARSGLIWGECCHISKKKKKKNQQERLVCVKDWLNEIPNTSNTSKPAFFPNGSVYSFRVPEFERHSAVAGVLTKMAASGHQGHFRDLQRQGGFDRSNILTIFVCTNSGYQNE